MDKNGKSVEIWKFPKIDQNGQKLKNGAIDKIFKKDKKLPFSKSSTTFLKLRKVV